MLYLASLPLSAMVTLALIKERRWIKDNLRALLRLLTGRGGMRELLRQKRDEIETEMTDLVRRIRQTWRATRRQHDE